MCIQICFYGYDDCTRDGEPFDMHAHCAESRGAQAMNQDEQTEKDAHNAEPDVYRAIKTDALLENVKLNEVNIALFFNSFPFPC